MTQLFIIAASFSLFTSACNESKQMTTTETVPKGSTVYKAPITDTYWALTEVNGKAVVQAPDEKMVYVRFNTTENKVDGSGGCNTMFGKYELSDNERIKITVGATKMACAGGKMEMENSFFNALSNADSYFIKGDTLHLFKAKMATLAKFEAKHSLPIRP